MTPIKNAPATSPPLSVLLVGQDNLFAEIGGCAVDHVPTGRTFTPAGAATRLRWRAWPRIFARLAAAKYDLIVLPAIDFGWSHDASRCKRILRSAAARLLRFRPISAALNGLLSRRNTQVIVLDRYDAHDTLLDFLRSLTCASFYFKTNLRETDHERQLAVGHNAGCRFKFLPYWVASDRYSISPPPEKDIDLFFAGAVNSEERRAALAEVRKLEPEGVRVRIVEGRLPFPEYLDLMSRSWLTLSPQGYGYNGFRHYESMLVGSIPVINRSEPPIMHDFVPGENCFLYAPGASDLNQTIRRALANKLQLQTMAQGLREFVLERHSLAGVGRYLLRTTFGDSPHLPRATAALTAGVLS
ncbi:MAG TPA: glycosyltransferase [Pirellulales bacterium]|jgi:hypothetical protein|nr:glycosyltransferase [Pirellulales bacterium]